MDDAEDLMRRADPARTLVDVRSEAEFEVDLRRITGSTERGVPTSPAHRRWPWIAASSVAASVIALAVLVQVWNPLTPTATAAATPPLLKISDNSSTLGEAVDRAMNLLQAQAGRDPERRSSSEGWYLQTDVSADGRSSSVITPQELQLVWSADLSGRITVTAGESYATIDGKPTAPDDGAAPAAGTPIREDVFPAGQMPVLFQSPPPTTSGEMRDYLSATLGIEADSDAAGYLDAVRVLMSEWTLSPGQQSAILEVISSLKGLEMAGDVTDRLGRAGVAFRATSDSSPLFEYLFIVSRDNGAILALETVYVGRSGELDLPVPSVVEYIAWK